MIALYIFIGIVVLIGAIIPLMLPSKKHLERSIEINASKEKVYEQISSFKNWVNWSPWQEKDPNAVLTYSGTEHRIGHSFSWKGDPKKVGQGSMTITSLDRNRNMVSELQFGKNPNTSPCTFKLEDYMGKTKVTWSFDADFGMRLPARYFGLMAEKFLGPDYEKGLANLKNYCEKN
jgi:hypothetical protein